MRIVPVGKGLLEASSLARWRNGSLEALRTPHMTTEYEQAEYINWVCKNPHKVRMWAFYRDEEELQYEPVAIGGLEHIEWENGTAELSLIVNPTMRRQGNGFACVELIFDIAFASMRLESVWSETYECNRAGLGLLARIEKTRRTHTCYLPMRKYWNGDFYGATWWGVPADRWLGGGA